MGGRCDVRCNKWYDILGILLTSRSVRQRQYINKRLRVRGTSGTGVACRRGEALTPFVQSSQVEQAVCVPVDTLVRLRDIDERKL